MGNDMEVNFIYMELLDFFPQVDLRILKAVAIENRTNIDAAFCVVMDLVLPYDPIKTSLHEDLSSQPAATAEGSVDEQKQVVQKADATPSSEGELAPNHDGLAHHLSIMPEQISYITSVHEDLGEEHGSDDSCQGEAYFSLMADEELVVLPTIGSLSAFMMHEVGNSNENLVSIDGKGLEEALGCDREREIDSYMAICEDEQEEFNRVSDSGLQRDESVTDWFHANVSANNLPSLPSHAKKIEFLESCIEEAKNNKRTLFSSIEEVMYSIREVEAREKAAEKAKEKAAKGGVEILSRAEELKPMLRKAKEANDMHAGEVYGERSILATDAKELESRLANLMEERDEALCILDEMHHSLEIRLSAADEEIKKAEEDKLEKENYVKMLLHEQDAIINKIVQEAKLLQLETEENSKLREFLVDRGHAVDALHGEIGVICQDVKFLKSKFDKRVPLSESVSSAETTCILASSSSSSKGAFPL